MVASFSAVVATLVAVAFGLATFERFLARGRRHEAAWSVALAMFAVASGALAVGATAGWTGATFRLFFLFGGILNVPFLAAGTVYLLRGPRWGDAAVVGITLFGVGSAVVLVATPMHGVLPHHELAQASKVLPGLPEALAAIASGAGSLVLVAGALYSVFRVRGRRFVLGNCTIAVGTLVSGASGLLNSVFDQMTAFAVALCLGIAIIFTGFLVTTDAPRAPRKAAAPVPTAG